MTTRRAIDILIGDLGTKSGTVTGSVDTLEEAVVVLISGLQILATAMDAALIRLDALDALDGPQSTTDAVGLRSEIHDLTTQLRKIAKIMEKVTKKK
jgi:hypothetical protein